MIDLESASFDRVNPAWSAALGWSVEEMDSHPYERFVHPDDLGASAAAFDQVRAGSPALRFENRYRTKDGAWRCLSWVAVPEGGKLYATSRDVTEEKMRAEALTAAEDTLRQSQKMDAVGQLTGGIAHDFNNMLAVVIGSLDLLERRLGVSDARAKRYVDAATDGARRAAALTQRLLAFSRQQPLRPEPIDANKLLFTDVVMPEVNGAKLAEQGRLRRADLRILFTTGYTRNAVVHNGVLDPGVELIGKPFTIEELAAKIRDVLDAPVSESGLAR